MAKYQMNSDLDMIEVMEADLVSKVTDAFNSLEELRANVQGVFDIDDLERVVTADESKGIAVGVFYAGATKAFNRPTAPNDGAIDAGNKSVMVEFRFMVVLAMCSDPACNYRYSATKLMTVMRLGIDGLRVGSDTYNRPWAFVGERPEITASDKDVLYYSQVWQLSMTSNGNTLNRS